MIFYLQKEIETSEFVPEISMKSKIAFQMMRDDLRNAIYSSYHEGVLTLFLHNCARCMFTFMFILLPNFYKWNRIFITMNIKQYPKHDHICIDLSIMDHGSWIDNKESICIYFHPFSRKFHGRYISYSISLIRSSWKVFLKRGRNWKLCDSCEIAEGAEIRAKTRKNPSRFAMASC